MVKNKWKNKDGVERNKQMKGEKKSVRDEEKIESHKKEWYKDGEKGWDIERLGLWHAWTVYIDCYGGVY